MPVANRVAMDLKCVLPVLEIIRKRSTLGRQLSRLAHRYETRTEGIRERRSKDETTRLDPDHRADFLALKLRGQRINRIAQSLGMFQQRRDVIKIDAGLGKVRHFAN